MVGRELMKEFRYDDGEVWARVRLAADDGRVMIGLYEPGASACLFLAPRAAKEFATVIHKAADYAESLGGIVARMDVQTRRAA